MHPKGGSSSQCCEELTIANATLDCEDRQNLNSLRNNTSSLALCAVPNPELIVAHEARLLSTRG